MRQLLAAAGLILAFLFSSLFASFSGPTVAAALPSLESFTPSFQTLQPVDSEFSDGNSSHKPVNVFLLGAGVVTAALGILTLIAGLSKLRSKPTQ